MSNFTGAPTDFVVYDDNGEIVQFGSCPDYMVESQEGGHVLPQKGTWKDNWVDVGAGQVKQRTSAPITVAGNVASNIPLPARAFVDGKYYTLTDSTLELTFQFPGTYKVTIYTVRHYPFEFTVTQ